MNMKPFLMGTALTALMLLPAAYGQAAETALMQAPARNAALIAEVPGFKSAKLDLYIGKRAISEGVLVRKSFIRDGKIVIPPAGLVYSSRIASVGTMTGIELMLLGKQYPQVDEEVEYLILKDKKMKLGDSVNLLPDGSRALQFVKGGPHPYGTVAADSATLRIMKSTGNYYGTHFTVATNSPLIDVNSGQFKGMGLPEGRHSLKADAGEPLQHNTYVGNSIYPSGNSYLIVGKVSAKEVEVKEFGTPSITRVWLASDPRVSGAYAAGQSVTIGGETLKVVSVSKDAVKLSLTNKAGKTVTREFTGISAPDATKYLPGSAADRARFQMASEDGKVRVQLAMLHPEGVLTADGKVRLDLFSGVFSFANPQPWERDPRFNVRPDTCASCRLLNEIVLENAEEIVLDAKNNVASGPEGYFKIVIDDFDGKKLRAWHFEDADGNKSPNLASFAGGAHIDLVANFENKSIGAFGNRTAQQALRRELKKNGFVMTK